MQNHIGKQVCWLEIDWGVYHLGQGEPVIRWGTLRGITDRVADIEVPTWFGHKHVSIGADRLFKERIDLLCALQNVKGNV